MISFREQEGLRYLSFSIFPENVTQAVFTRHGGLSPDPWGALNVGGTVGDDPERVRENRYRSFRVVGRDPESMYDVWQVHSADVVIANGAHPRFNNPPELKADAILTDNPNITLFMRFADCTPILLHDPVKGVVGVVHAGWMGTAKHAAGQAVRAMQHAYGSRPADILAAIGPSIGPDHYEVGPEVAARVQHAFGNRAAELLLPKETGRPYFDLWAANRLSLQMAGVEQVQVAGICTACHEQDWYSHRAHKGKTGRFGALIALS